MKEEVQTQEPKLFGIRIGMRETSPFGYSARTPRTAFLEWGNQRHFSERNAICSTWGDPLGAASLATYCGDRGAFRSPTHDSGN